MGRERSAGVFQALKPEGQSTEGEGSNARRGRQVANGGEVSG